MSIPCVMYPDRSNCLTSNTFLHVYDDGSGVTIAVQSNRANADVKLPVADAIDIAERILRAFAPERLTPAADAVSSARTE